MYIKIAQTIVITIILKIMKATIKQSENNERDLTVSFSGYGHWNISCMYKGKRIYAITTDSIAIDNWQSEQGETMQNWRREGRPTNRILAGYVALCGEIISKNKY